MPACLVHYTFAKENTPEEERPYFDAIALGTQGPDPYFYYGILPMWSGEDKKEIDALGNTLHHSDIGPVYAKMLSYAIKSEKKDMLFAYLDALWMHYCVDRNLHPYVFARSGVDENGELHGFYKYSHGKFEAILDVYFAKKHGSFTKTSGTIKVKGEDLLEISKMWYVLHDEYPVLKEDSFLRAARAYKGVEEVLWTRTGLKRILFRATGKHSLAIGMSYPKRYHRYDGIDILNESKSVWPDPMDGHDRTESVEELFANAKADYEKVHEILLRGYEGEPVAAELSAFYDGRDHDGTKEGKSIAHFALCWEKE